MEYLFRFAYPWIGACFLILVIISIFLSRFTRKPIIFNYSLTQHLADRQHYASQWPQRIGWLLRLLSLASLAALIARPQLVDSKSKINKEGHEIYFVFDVSGSMQCFDDLHDTRTRFEVAKHEALRFIEKRDDDQLGLVLFGAASMTRCPLTADKKILKEIIEQLNLGEINPDGTVLSVAVSMAVQRLSNSKAKNKIIILLTDGEPTPGLDIDPQLPIDLAKKFGIKIYAIGIGDEHGGMLINPMFNMVQTMGFRLNKQLLERFASQTGGQFFHAKKPDDLRKIYAVIDALEKTEYETTIFSRYHELCMPFVTIAGLSLLVELIITTFIWFAV